MKIWFQIWKDAHLVQDITVEDYEQDTIRELLALFPSKEEKLKLIDVIEEKRFEPQATLIGSDQVLLEYDPDSLPF